TYLYSYVDAEVDDGVWNVHVSVSVFYSEFRVSGMHSIGGNGFD
ncbi:unnamed protein product, partial [Linum tenue]